MDVFSWLKKKNNHKTELIKPPDFKEKQQIFRNS